MKKEKEKTVEEIWQEILKITSPEFFISYIKYNNFGHKEKDYSKNYSKAKNKNYEIR